LPQKLGIGAWLSLSGCTSLTSLPEGLSIGSYLRLFGCTSLASLPKSLFVGSYLGLTKDLQEQVKRDAERLKREGKIVGDVLYK